MLLLLTSCRKGFPGQVVAEPPPEEVHVLSWTGYDGVNGDDNKARYLFDGKEVGIGMHGISRIGNIDIPKTSIIQIHFPIEAKLSNKLFSSPLVRYRLILNWLDSGIRIEYYFNGNKIDVHTLIVKPPSYEAEQEWLRRYLAEREGSIIGWPLDDNAFEWVGSYYFDTEYYGVGKEAFDKLAKVRLKSGNYVQIIFYWPPRPTSGPPMLFDSPYILKKGSDLLFIKLWEAEGVLVDVFE